jgi:hypothetical protein
MTPWEDRIISAFIERYPASKASETGKALRLAAEKIFPDFDNASPDEKESFLDAAESLEAQQFLSLVWVRHRKGELLSALICPDVEKLYEGKERPSPKIAAEAARSAAREAARKIASQTGNEDPNTEKARVFFNFLAENIAASDAAKGITADSVNDLAKLFLAISEPINLTLRALSVSLYNDSKRLEALVNSFKAIFTRAERQGIAIPELSFLDRSFPEVSIADKKGLILTLPLITIQKITSIESCFESTGEAPSVLMIENKETFYALAASNSKYDRLLYVGGHPNRAVRALVTILAKSDFAFYHAGDLDPDGILILQELQKIAGKTIMPVNMDAPTFDAYLKHARKLEPTMLQRLKLIKSETRSLPGIQELIQKIEITGKGIEQEIIEYDF